MHASFAFSQTQTFTTATIADGALPRPLSLRVRARRSVPEHRQFFRRFLNLPDVLLSDADLEHGLPRAQITDMSRTGIGLWRAEPLEVGDCVNVGVPDCEDVSEWTIIYWVSVEIVHCRSDSMGYVIRCRFSKPPSRTILLALDALAQQ